MNLELVPLHVVEVIDRRVLGAFRLVDAATGLPLNVPAVVAVRGAAIGSTAVDVGGGASTVRLLRNRRGLFVILSAPFFAGYTASFESPTAPPETAADPLRLRLAITDAGADHLPREFTLDLPRPLARAAADGVFAPQPVELYRAPNAGVQPGWTVLRVRVTAVGVSPPRPLPGVLVRIFRAQHGPADRPLGSGMTEWRGGVAGEAVVALTGVQRFMPGSGASVIDTDVAIEFEATRDTAFTGAAEAVPDVATLLSGSGSGILRAPSPAPGPSLTVLQPVTAPMRVQAGREYVVHLAMP